MTPAQWAAVEASLAFPHGRAELLCDGRKVVAQVQMTKPLRFAVVVFVDGQWRGEWLRADPPRDEHRFLNPHERAMHKAADIKLFRKVYSAKQMREITEKKLRWYSPDFPTAKAFRRRISSSCKDIALVTCSEAEIAALKAKQDALVAGALLGIEQDLAKEPS